MNIVKQVYSNCLTNKFNRYKLKRFLVIENKHEEEFIDCSLKNCFPRYCFVIKKKLNKAINQQLQKFTNSGNRNQKLMKSMHILLYSIFQYKNVFLTNNNRN